MADILIGRSIRVLLDAPRSDELEREDRTECLDNCRVNSTLLRLVIFWNRIVINQLKAENV